MLIAWSAEHKLEPADCETEGRKNLSPRQIADSARVSLPSSG
jgi:hypothetical protein